MTSPTPLPPLTAFPAPGAPAQGLMSAALPLLRPEEEPTLGFWIEAGILATEALAGDAPSRDELTEVQNLGARALERMTRSNIRLVYYWVSRSWTGRETGDLDVEDLAAVGIEGLIHAIWMWDYRRGLKFSTYASTWIRQYLSRAVIRARGLQPGGTDTELLEELFRTRAVLEVRLGRSASHRELADALEITPAALGDLLLLDRNVRAMVRLDRPVGHDTASTVGDLLIHSGRAPDELVGDAELHDELAAALQQLSPRERSVVACRVGWSGPVLSEEEVATRYGVSVAQVRTTTQGALMRLRGLLGDGLTLGAAA
ncbi:MAG: sigma-70 family RNA polymerase sigma factor [Intrasporangium sp.]|uniref:sigma-70 family RNA polymerase sigma factor n=1 Tax=Intrasporangium sp. TaxID=1925024 RepID=UPI002649BBE7|nr:sigma-70 family RNA polymerase sigma factor [Intrasporangium sp.]MDN5798166.1 sigma-70 family RNA polymerase sigma factor [Intrasporangium sp.]